MIDIVINEPLIDHVHEYDFIIVGTNCYQSMRHGFQFEVARMYPEVLKCNYKTRYADRDKLGDIVECNNFILAFITFGYNFKGDDTTYLDYDALVKCLRRVNILYKGKCLATTMLGTTQFDGNGDTDKVLDIINREMTHVDLTIYDYRQESHNTLTQREYFNRFKDARKQ